MKKAIQFLFAGVFILTLASCNNSKAVAYQKDNGSGGYTEEKIIMTLISSVLTEMSTTKKIVTLIMLY